MRANAVSTNSAKASFALLLACACVLGKFRSRRIFGASVSRIFGFSAYGFLCGCCSNLGGLLKDFLIPSRSEGTLGDFSPSVRNGGINGDSVSSVRNGGFLELLPARIGAAVAKNSACQISVCYGSQFGDQATACDLDLPFAVFLLSALDRNGNELLTWAVLLANRCNVLAVAVSAKGSASQLFCGLRFSARELAYPLNSVILLPLVSKCHACAVFTCPTSFSNRGSAAVAKNSNCQISQGLRILACGLNSQFFPCAAILLISNQCGDKLSIFVIFNKDGQMKISASRKKLAILALTLAFIYGVVELIAWGRDPSRMTDEELRRKYIKILSCTPRKPIDKNELFAEAMKQYWQYRMDELWFQDEAISDWYGQEYITVEKQCGLKIGLFGKSITKKTCYPWLVTYKNPEELYKALISTEIPETGSYSSEWDAFRKRMQSLHARSYNPKSGANPYLGQKKFSIIKKEGWDPAGDSYVYFYSSECCRLVPYTYFAARIANFTQHDDYPRIIDIMPKQLLEQIYFLEIKRHPVDKIKVHSNEGLSGTNLADSNLNKDEFFKVINYVNYRYYPVSLCGKAVFSLR